MTCLILPLYSDIKRLHPSQHQKGCMRVNGAPEHIVHGAHCCHRFCFARQSTCTKHIGAIHAACFFRDRCAGSMQ